MQFDPGVAPAQARARAYVRSLIEDNHLSAGDRLPSVRQLARDAGMAYVSMQKAVRGLVAEGVVSARPRAGIRVLGDASPSASRAAPVREPEGRGSVGCRRLVDILRTDLMCGQVPFGPRLPMLKELSQRYGSCPATLRKALDVLVAERLLQPFGRGYRLSGVLQQTGRTVVALLVPPEGTPAATATFSVTRLVHLEAAAAGVQLLTIPFNGYRHDAADCRRVIERIDASGVRRRLLGLIGCNVTGEQSSFEDLLPHLRSLEAPVALADDTGMAPYASAARCKGLQWFSTGGTSRCGEVVGRYLLGAEHRSIAYITTDPDKAFCANRYDGLARAAAAGGAVLHRVSPVSGSSHAALRGELWRESWPAFGSLFASGSLGRVLPASVVDRLQGDCSQMLIAELERHAMETVLQPMLTRALHELDATAWVAQNDPTAVACRQFLEARSVAVPGSVSVVGFDDSPGSAEYDLTTYNFNAPGIVRAMLQHVLHPGHGRRPTRRTPVDIDGYVVERGSAPRAPTR